MILILNCVLVVLPTFTFQLYELVLGILFAIQLSEPGPVDQPIDTLSITLEEVHVMVLLSPTKSVSPPLGEVTVIVGPPPPPPVTCACCVTDKEVIMLFKEADASASFAAMSLKTSAEAIIGETNKIVAKKILDNRVLNEKLL